MVGDALSSFRHLDLFIPLGLISDTREELNEEVNNALQIHREKRAQTYLVYLPIRHKCKKNAKTWRNFFRIFIVKDIGVLENSETKLGRVAEVSERFLPPETQPNVKKSRGENA